MTNKEVIEQNARFIERLQSGKVNYEWTVQDKLHNKQKDIVEHLVSERRPKMDIEVKRLKDMDKQTFEEVMGDALCK